LKKTKVINLFGGSGIGKSTTAAELFVALKKQGKSVELVQEYVKEWAWQKREINQFDQVYITAKQIRRESQLYGKVDYIITDCPLILGLCYSLDRAPDVYGGLKELVDDVMHLAKIKYGVQYEHFTLSREKDFVAEGRYETEEEAKLMDGRILNYLTRRSNSHLNTLNERYHATSSELSKTKNILKALDMGGNYDS